MKVINWSPFATNPIDYIDGKTKHQFISEHNEIVKITISMSEGFIVWIGDKRIVTDSNTNTCYFLNQNGVGIKT